VALAVQFPLVVLATSGLRELASSPAALFASLSLGAFVATLSERRLVRAILAVILGLAIVTQLVALRLYHAPIDLQVARAARRASADVIAAMRGSATWLALGAVVGVALEYGLLSLSHRARSRHDRPLFAGAFVAAVALGPGLDASGPDLRLASALRAFAEPVPPRAPGSPSLPLLPTARSRVPSVLWIITESVRASDYASDAESAPETCPEVAALFPDRIGLRELRATSSYTTISVAAMTTGRAQLGTKSEIAGAPNLFDLAKSVRVEGRAPWVAYYSAQSVTGVFERENIRDACDRFVGLEDLEATCRPGPSEPCTRDTLDRRIVDLFVREIEHAPDHAVVVLHLYDTHVPYAFDDARAKFRPFSREVSWESLDSLHAAYENAILAQDAEIARAAKAFVASRGRAPWVVLFTSDHGEAFGEHHAIHHGQNLYDEQIHVPGFVAASAGALERTELEALAVRAAGPTSHSDLLPTVLDVLGVWSSPALGRERAAMLGSSLLGHERPRRAVPMTSCNASYPCPLDTWGMLGETHALVGQSWDKGFRCVKLDDAATPADDPECASLRAESKRYFATMPGGVPNL
jgi:hypothetical protein